MQHRRTSEPRYRKSSLNPRGSAGSFISHFVLSKRGGVRGDSATFCVPMTTGGPSALSFAGKNFPDRINARETHTERERERESHRSRGKGKAMTHVMSANNFPAGHAIYGAVTYAGLMRGGLKLFQRVSFIGGLLRSTECPPPRGRR